ncbi:MAG TPA: carbohydrate ABC transporter permease, partial [Desulfurococcaceae archaeon]|nr:carbohydrate ABC transporter permease [Desulfurococcaceae archaeon]
MSDIEYELMPTKRRTRVLLYILLILMTLPIAIPYAWLIIGSFAKDLKGVIPTAFTLENWKFLVQPIRVPGAATHFPDVWICTLNTFYIAIGTTVLTLLLSLLGGYALSRLKFFGRTPLLSLVMIVRAFPGITLLVALFYIIRVVQLYGSVISVILTKTAMMLPLGLWVMKGFFDNV